MPPEQNDNPVPMTPEVGKISQTSDALDISSNPLTMNTLRQSKVITDLQGLSGRVLIVGGTFDPPHLGHLEIALLAASSANVQADLIVFMPAKRNPLKQNGPRASDEDRVEMLVRMLKDQPKCVVCTYEQTSHREPSYTIDTLEEGKRVMQPGSEIFLLMGGDNVRSFDKWHRYQEIVQLAHPVLAARNGMRADDIDALNPGLSDDVRKAFRERFIQVENPISSTSIRDNIRAGESEKIASLVHPAVYDLLIKKKLYQKES